MSDVKSNPALKLDMILFLIFMTLKLTGYIDWSWWYVTMPLWLPASILLFVAICIGLFKLPNKY